MKAAFTAGRAAIDQKKLRSALTLKNYHSVEEVMDGPLTAMRASLAGTLPAALAEVRDTTGENAYRMLQTRLKPKKQFRAAAAKVGVAFDVTNPSAVDWTRSHSAELIDGISETTREEIRSLIEAAFVEQFDVDELSTKIADVIGDDARAEEIARTETMAASNEGQQEAWDQAVEDGLLTGNELQEWIVTPDDRLCPICEGLDGVQAGLGEFFESDGDQYDGPPAHPNCRCTLGLVIP